MKCGAFVPSAVNKHLEILPINNITIVESEKVDIPITVETDPLFTIINPQGDRCEPRETITQFSSGLRGLSLRFNYNQGRTNSVIMYRPITVASESNNTDNFPPKIDSNWLGNELERNFIVNLAIVCHHANKDKEHEHKAYRSFYIRLLRDKNKNKIADIYENLETSNLCFKFIPDVVLQEGKSSTGELNYTTYPNIPITTYHVRNTTNDGKTLELKPVVKVNVDCPVWLKPIKVQDGKYPVYCLQGSPDKIS